MSMHHEQLLENASEFQEYLESEGYSPSTAIRTYKKYAWLGWLDRIYFRDTGKPRAVLIYPSIDAKGAFNNVYTQNFLKCLGRHYDVLLRVAESENDAYLAMSSTPNISLLVLAGHGNNGVLSFGESEQQVYHPRSEELVLTKQDVEIGYYLNGLKENAVIFLHSCKSKNLVDFIKERAGERTVIGSTQPFSTLDIHVKSYVPFDIAIKLQKKLPFLPSFEVDCTYKR